MRSVLLLSVDGLRLDAAVHEPDEPAGMGTVILTHGITVDMDEGGMFVRLADRLADAGFTVVRFSFRGHGKSQGSQRGVTIAGEMLDLQAVCEYVADRHPGPLSMVAASFGAVATAESLPYLDEQLTSLVLWNPVLDLRRTFLQPELPWGLENFGSAQREMLRRQGFLLVDGEFQLGRVLFDEFDRYRPADASPPAWFRRWSCTVTWTATCPTTSLARLPPGIAAALSIPSPDLTTGSTLGSVKTRRSASP